ncbi:MAG: DUF86 domain-containing protein [Nanoarchaeota archaeon]|nr:DUF86 domain-containing protein [Nanoarchaeota archaeon]MBU0977218.1 DUF86 domain-containing protein [Nanoarchaeota archaeon]
MKRESLIFVEHILESIKDIENFIKGVSRESFMKNKEKQSAVVRQIEIIGEASKNLPENFKEKYPEISWKEIIGSRDKIIHHYFGVDLGIVWEIVTINLLTLKKQIKDILKAEKRA